MGIVATQATADNGDTITVGDRVELHPATDAWMMGDRYGVVQKVGTTRVQVKLDRSGRERFVHFENIASVVR
jgi:hypothetical protein